jgi:hypothetical protein
MHWTVGRIKDHQSRRTGNRRQHALHPAARDQRGNPETALADSALSRPRKAGSRCRSTRCWSKRPSRRIIVDTGFGNDKQGRNVPTWNDRNDPFLETADGGGLPRPTASIPCCARICTSTMSAGTPALEGGKWVPTFANARYVFGRTEFEHWRDHSDDADKVRRVRRFRAADRRRRQGRSRPPATPGLRMKSP